MRRIRLALLAVALGLGIPVGVLAWRALDGLALERAVRHQALAERAFDEMERALSAWLEREESRPFEEYRFYVAPERRSPLAGAPSEDFVVGAFQVDPDGSVHTPMQPRDLAAATVRGDWPPPDTVQQAIARVTRVARETWKEDGPGRKVDGVKRRSELESGERQDPGTTRPIAGPLAGKELAKRKRDDDAKDEDANVYDVLQRFNRGADSRSQRKQKIAAARIPPKAAAPAPSRPQAARAKAPEPEDAADTLSYAQRSAAATESSQQEEAPALRSYRGDALVVADSFGEEASPASEPVPQDASADAESVPREGAEEAEPARERIAMAAPPSLADATLGGAGAAAGESVEVEVEELDLNQLRALGYVVSEEVVDTALAKKGTANAPSARDAAEDVPVSELREADRADARPAATEVRLALDPMVGRAADDGQLLLYRTVLVGELGYRQGLLVDREKLGAWLSARALEPAGLSRFASVRFADDGTPEGNAAFVFQHRFAEPFDALSAQLSLAALPGVGRPAAIYGLVGLLALVGVAGLLAIHQMVGVAVHFAERRSNFVSAVTHELKTPLTAIRMYGEMLRDGLVPNEAKRSEYYGTITDESERLSRLIDNVLEFSRLERGTREMNWSVGSVEPVVREAADKLRAHAEHEGFQLEVEIEPALPPVRYDRDALLQVLFNLVDNAMKYAGTATPRRVVLEARRHGGGVELAVRDFGPGVSGRHLSRIFEPFYRGEDELTRSAKGTGIGLALVRDLSERMGAAVRGANAEGGGFRVCVAFDASEA